MVYRTSGLRLQCIATHSDFFKVNLILLCFKYAISGDRQCITLGGSLLTLNQFLVSNESHVCELCVSMFRNKWYWFIQIHLASHILPQSNRNQPSDASWMWPHSGTLWHICEDVIFCKNDKYFVQSHIKYVFSYKTKLLFNRVQNVVIK